MPLVAQSAGKRLLSTIRGANPAEWSGSMSVRRLPSNEYFDGARMAADGDLEERDAGLLPERDVLRADPRCAQEVLERVAAPGVVRLAAEEREVERLRRLDVLRPAAVAVAVQVVVERLERALAQAAAVDLHADDLAPLARPFGGAARVAQVALALAREVELVEEVGRVVEADRAVHPHVHGRADAHAGEADPEDARDERRGRGDDVREEPFRVHLAKDLRDEVRELGRNRLVAVAVRVEERVEAKAVLARPSQVAEQPFAHLGRERRRGAAREHAGPGEEDLGDARQEGRARLPEGGVVKMADGQVLSWCGHGVCGNGVHHTTLTRESHARFGGAASDRRRRNRPAADGGRRRRGRG